MGSPLFSIITVTFNRAYSIEKAIESVLNQTIDDYEYIIIDGNSSDNTLEIITQYKSKFSEKKISFRFVSEPDNGIYDAMNKGINLSQGKYIGIVNSDDHYKENTLEIVKESLIAKPSADIVHGNIEIVKKGNTQIVKPDSIVNIYKNIPSLHPATFISKNVFERIGLYNLKYKIAADQDLLVKAFIHKFEFNYIDDVLSVFSQEGVSSSKTFAPLIESHKIRVQYGQSKMSSSLVFLRSLIIRILQKMHLDKMIRKLMRKN